MSWSPILKNLSSTRVSPKVTVHINMVIQILHVSQWCYKHRLKAFSKLFDKLLQILCAADIPGCANIHKSVSFSHGAHGVIINPQAEVGKKCIIGPKVTLGNAFPHGGAPRLGSHVYVGVGAFLGGVFISLIM